MTNSQRRKPKSWWSDLKMQKLFSDYWQKNELPFIGLPDPSHTVLKRYGQEVNLFKFGRMPAQVAIDKTGNGTLRPLRT